VKVHTPDEVRDLRTDSIEHFLLGTWLAGY
jgi:hypothetical protein